MENDLLKITIKGLYYTPRKNGKKMVRTFPDLNDWMNAACSSGNKRYRDKDVHKNPGTYAKGAMKRKFQKIAVKAIKEQAKDRHITGDVFMYYYFYEKDKRRDPSNISAFFIKVFEDALQECGVIDNDGWNIKGFVCYFATDKYLPRVEVAIEEIEPKKTAKPKKKEETESE